MRLRTTPMIFASLALVIASCGPKSLALPDDPIDRAATCGAVAAASERAANPDVNTPLSLEAIGRVVHYPLLAGSAGESFSANQAAAVQARMSEIQNAVIEGKWKELIPACKAAFPAAAVTAVTLPGDRFQAELGCDELGDFLRSSLEAQPEYVNELAEYRQLSHKLDQSIAVGLRGRAGSAQDQRRQALSAIAEAGPPVAVMRACLDRFGQQ